MADVCDTGQGNLGVRYYTERYFMNRLRTDHYRKVSAIKTRVCVFAMGTKNTGNFCI